MPVWQSPPRGDSSTLISLWWFEPITGNQSLARARIAQRGERPAHIGEVAGSIPAPRIATRTVVHRPLPLECVRFIRWIRRRVLAQAVAHRVRDAGVAGSSPAHPTRR